jgi:hypothetical protein
MEGAKAAILGLLCLISLGTIGWEMRVQSFSLSAIRSAAYEADTETLTVYWHNGRKSSHYLVPEWVAVKIFSLADPYSFYLNHIRDTFPATQLSWRSLFKRRRDSVAQSEIEAWEREMSAG